MMELFFDIGGSVLRLTAPEGAVALTGGVLEPFVVEKAPWDFWMDLAVVDALPGPAGNVVFHSPERRVYADGDAFITYIGSTKDSWNGAFLRIERRGNTSIVQAKGAAFDRPIQSKTILWALEAEHLAVEGGGFLFHSSFISHQGEAILFTAPSGTGKSTQAELWRSLRGAQIINGDRSVIRRTENGFVACGTPFCGSSHISGRARLPLRAIVFLSQAPETTIARLTGLRAFRAIWEGCSVHTWNRSEVDRCTQIITDLIAQVPVYHLACRPDVSAVAALETELRK